MSRGRRSEKRRVWGLGGVDEVGVVEGGFDGVEDERVDVVLSGVVIGEVPHAFRSSDGGVEFVIGTHVVDAVFVVVGVEVGDDGWCPDVTDEGFNDVAVAEVIVGFDVVVQEDTTGEFGEGGWFVSRSDAVGEVLYGDAVSYGGDDSRELDAVVATVIPYGVTNTILSDIGVGVVEGVWVSVVVTLEVTVAVG